MAAAGLGDDLLLANEVRRRAAGWAQLARAGARVTVAVDSDETVEAAADGGVREVLIDVNVGLPRCGCEPDDAGRLADLARRTGLEVRGVMGYEGHVVGLDDRPQRRDEDRASAWQLLLEAHDDVGGDIVSAGGTGTYDINTWATEIQAGSYALMDTAYGKLGLPFRQALYVLATVISVVATGWAVARLRASRRSAWTTATRPSTAARCGSAPTSTSRLGPRRTARRRSATACGSLPAHVDPTIAYHERMHLADGDDVVDVVGRRPARLVGSIGGEQLGQRAQRAAAVRHRVLLVARSSRRTCGRRPRRARRPGRSRSRRSPRGASAIVPVDDALGDDLAPVGERARAPRCGSGPRRSVGHRRRARASSLATLSA